MAEISYHSNTTAQNPSKFDLRRNPMKYTVLLEESEEGFAVSVPGLPGCHSQGDTEADALANITDAIREYLDVVRELAASSAARQMTVEV